MSTDLSADHEQYLQYTVQTGMFRSRGEALDTAVELLKRREQLIRDVNQGIAELERNEGMPFDVDEIMAAIDEEFERTRPHGITLRWPRTEMIG